MSVITVNCMVVELPVYPDRWRVSLFTYLSNRVEDRLLVGQCAYLSIYCLDEGCVLFRLSTGEVSLCRYLSSGRMILPVNLSIKVSLSIFRVTG